MIYLASPYSDPDPAVEQQRFEAVCKVAAVLMGNGHVIFAPVAHTHSIAAHGAVPRDHDFWERMDLPLLARADELWVLMLPGWQDSKGVQGEIATWAALVTMGLKEEEGCARFIHPASADYA